VVSPAVTAAQSLRSPLLKLRSSLTGLASAWPAQGRLPQKAPGLPAGPQTLSQTESVSQGGPDRTWLVHYQIGGQQLTDYWFYAHRRWVLDLVLSNPGAVKLSRMSPQQYVKALGCAH
jgi:hypothetical protein